MNRFEREAQDFQPALTREQCEKIGSPSHSCYVHIRFCLAFLSKSAAELRDIWRAEPQGLQEILNYLPDTLDDLENLKEIVELAQSRLIVTKQRLKS